MDERVFWGLLFLLFLVFLFALYHDLKGLSPPVRIVGIGTGYVVQFYDGTSWRGVSKRATGRGTHQVRFELWKIPEDQLVQCIVATKEEAEVVKNEYLARLELLERLEK